jgi:TatD DNase family protein
MIDIHCHLSESVFDKDREEVIQRARCTIIDSAVEPELWEKGLEISRSHNSVFSSIGLDPCKADEPDYNGLAQRCMEFIRANKQEIVAVGEVGLDFMRVKKNRDLQTEVFRRFISLAKELGLPIIIHSRWAHKQAIDVLTEERAEKVVLHAFPGAAKDAARAVAEGYLISIPTSVLYTQQKQELVKGVDLKHLVIETDSPVMAPVRGERNEPANLKLVAGKIAEIKGVGVKEVEEVTTKNARNILGLKG